MDLVSDGLTQRREQPGLIQSMELAQSPPCPSCLTLFFLLLSFRKHVLSTEEKKKFSLRLVLKCIELQGKFFFFLKLRKKKNKKKLPWRMKDMWSHVTRVHLFLPVVNAVREGSVGTKKGT